MKLASTLLTILADGHFHSGTELGHATGRTRSAVWKAIQALQSMGIDTYSVRGKGYRLHQPIELLDRNKILSGLNNKTRTAMKRLEVFFEINSTNAYLLELARQGNNEGMVCLAESQGSGRGRRGRTWVSPFGGNLYLSLLWHFPFGAAQLTGLSLAMAVAVCRALGEPGFNSVGVKWPNDIVVSNRKLAGILLEMAGEASGPCSVVIGVGLNVRNMPAMAAIEQPWTDLETELGKTVQRNDLAARLINSLVDVVGRFESDGLAPFLDKWREMDVYKDRNVELHLPGRQVLGISRGVDDSGALVLETGGEVRCFQSGEVSLRAI